jgi:phage-related tail protein
MVTMDIKQLQELTEVNASSATLPAVQAQAVTVLDRTEKTFTYITAILDKVEKILSNPVIAQRFKKNTPDTAGVAYVPNAPKEIIIERLSYDKVNNLINSLVAAGQGNTTLAELQKYMIDQKEQVKKLIEGL